MFSTSTIKTLIGVTLAAFLIGCGSNNVDTEVEFDTSVTFVDLDEVDGPFIIEAAPNNSPNEAAQFVDLDDVDGPFVIIGYPVQDNRLAHSPPNS